MEKNVDLAAALLYIEGESVPHPMEMEQKARELSQELGGRLPILKRVLELCGEPSSPREWYLAAKANAWMGSGHEDAVIRCAQAYLEGKPWDAFSTRSVTEDGIASSRASASRASILRDMAAAYESKGDLDIALTQYLSAYHLEPANALSAVKAADVIVKRNGREEAQRFLISQQGSAYYKPVKYKDAAGRVRVNDTFQQTLDAHIRRSYNKAP